MCMYIYMCVCVYMYIYIYPYFVSFRWVSRSVATKKDTEEGAGNEEMEERREDCAFTAYTEVRSRAEITRSPFMR